MSDEAEKDGFLARWSRRKRAAEADPAPRPADPPAPDAAATPGAGAPEAGTDRAGAPPLAARPACPIPDLPAIDLASLPRIEDLTAESDFSLFLRPGIPAMLRDAALKRMWSLDPAIRDYIGPVEYQWDFNTPGGLPFGFGPDLGGDAAKLLAQAIGQVERLAGRLEGDDPAAPPSGPATAGAPPAPAAGPDLLAAAEPPPADPEAPAPAAAVEPAMPRRRHGGALPR